MVKSYFEIVGPNDDHDDTGMEISRMKSVMKMKMKTKKPLMDDQRRLMVEL